MDAFRGIGMRGSATLAGRRPGNLGSSDRHGRGLGRGHSGGGAYNYYLNRIKVLNAQMENFASELLNIIERHFLKA